MEKFTRPFSAGAGTDPRAGSLALDCGRAGLQCIAQLRTKNSSEFEKLTDCPFANPTQFFWAGIDRTGAVHSNPARSSFVEPLP